MNNNILSSIALFSELYKQDKDVSIIIGEFIKSTVKLENIQSFNDVEMDQLLQKNFNISIPISLINYVVKHTLNEDFVKIGSRKNSYNVSNIESINGAEFRENYSRYTTIYQTMMDSAYLYIENNDPTETHDKEFVKTDFIAFLLKQNTSKYARLYEMFVVSNIYKESFKESLDLITEGVVVYSGVQYTTPETINKKKNWKTPLVIYIDTEQIFSFAGYSDPYYERIFLDLFSLINDINIANNKKVISLKYFEETHNEVVNYFDKAEQIIEGKSTLLPGKEAMAKITHGCKDVFDIRAKKSKLFRSLNDSGIIYDEDTVVEPSWSVATHSTLDDIEQDLKSSNIQYNDQEINNYIDIFSKINLLRRGNNNVSFEECKYVFLSADRLARYLAACEYIRCDERMRFSTDIDYVTSILWFTLQKPFTSGKAPITFDIISRSQLALKAHYTDAISQTYKELVNKNMPNEVRLDIYNELHCKGAISAEDIKSENLPEILELLRMPDIDTLLQERSMRQLELEKAKDLQKEYQETLAENTIIKNQAKKEHLDKIIEAREGRKRERAYRTKINSKTKQSIRRFIKVLYSVYGLAVCGLVLYSASYIYTLKQQSDSYYSTISVVLSSISFILSALPFVKKPKRFILKKIQMVCLSYFISRIER